MTAALLAQEGHNRLRNVHDTVEVGIDLRPERVDRRVLKRAQVTISGVVDDDIDATECLLGLSNHTRSRVVVGHVEPQQKHRVAVLVEEVLQPLRVTRRRRHAFTRFERDLDERATQTARTSRHEPHLGHRHSYLAAAAFSSRCSRLCGCREVGEKDHSGVEPLHVLERQANGPSVAEHVNVSLAPDERV